MNSSEKLLPSRYQTQVRHYYDDTTLSIREIQRAHIKSEAWPIWEKLWKWKVRYSKRNPVADMECHYRTLSNLFLTLQSRTNLRQPFNEFIDELRNVLPKLKNSLWDIHHYSFLPPTICLIHFGTYPWLLVRSYMWVFKRRGTTNGLRQSQPEVERNPFNTSNLRKGTCGQPCP